MVILAPFKPVQGLFMGIDIPSLKLAVDNAHVLLDSVTSRLLLQHCFNHGKLTSLRRDSAICGNEMVYINPLLDWNPPSLLFISTSPPKQANPLKTPPKEPFFTSSLANTTASGTHLSYQRTYIYIYIYIKKHQEQG